MLSRTILKNSHVLKVTQRGFGGGGHPFDKPKPTLGPNGLQPVIKHPDGHDDHHHAIHAAPLDHKFIAPGVNKNTLFFDGLKATAPQEVVLDNQFHQLNGLSMFQ